MPDISRDGSQSRLRRAESWPEQAPVLPELGLDSRGTGTSVTCISGVRVT